MGYANRRLPHNPLSKSTKSENPKNPTTSSDTDDLSNSHIPLLPVPTQSGPSICPLSVDGSDENSPLAGYDFIARDEVLRRRSRRLRQLARFYRDQYWALMEEIRVKHREYYWDYGKSAFKDDDDDLGRDGEREGTGETDATHKNRLGVGFENSYGTNAEIDGNYKRCGFHGCKSKAMALTSYCHQHVLLDSKQKLYKPCIASVGQVACGKPILRAAMPSLCSGHLQKYEKNMLRALKKGGLNIASSSKAPKFSLIIAEYVKQIQSKRREAQDMIVKNIVIKEESGP